MQDTYLGRDRTGKRSVEARIAALTTAMEAVGDDSWTNDAEEHEAGLDLHFRLKRERERLIVEQGRRSQIVSSNGQNSAERVDEGEAIQEYNSYRDNKEAYLNKEHPEWMEKQYGKICQKCGFRHFPRPECPGDDNDLAPIP